MFRVVIKDEKIEIKFLFLKIRISRNIQKIILKNFKFILLFLDFIIPKNDKKIVALLYPKQENKVDSYLSWIKKNHTEYDCIRITENINEVSNNNKTYLFWSFKGFWELYRAKYVVIASTRFTDFILPQKHIGINLWHGMPIKTLGLTDVLPKDIEDAYKTIGEYYKTFATSDLFKQIMSSCFRAKYENVFVTGLPVTDSMLDENKNENITKYFDFQKYDKTIFFLPTFKSKALCHQNQINKEYNNIFYMDDYIGSDFIEFLERHNILFVMKPHPLDENFYKEQQTTLPVTDNFKIIYDENFKSNGFELYELLKYADLMISDFSSITLDFLILNRPIIYLDNLTDEYSKNRGMILSDNYEFLMLGHKVKTFSDLIEKIVLSLSQDDTKLYREKNLPLIHKYRDNKASERIFKIMIGDINE